MSKNNLKRRQIMFDLDTKVCEMILGPGYRSVYKTIENYMKNNGFDHPQGSGYISQNNLSDTEVWFLINGIIKQYPYLKKCVRDIRVADINRINSLNYMFNYDGAPGKYKQKQSLKSKLNNAVKQTESSKENYKTVKKRNAKDQGSIL